MKDKIVGNIGPLESKKRLILGIAFVLIAILMSIPIAISRLSFWWYLVLFFPYLGAFICLLQARYKTCIALAARGMCNYDDGVQKIENSEYLKRIDALANKIIYQSAGLALVMAGLSVIIMRSFSS